MSKTWPPPLGSKCDLRARLAPVSTIWDQIDVPLQRHEKWARLMLICIKYHLHCLSKDMKRGRDSRKYAQHLLSQALLCWFFMFFYTLSLTPRYLFTCFYVISEHRASNITCFYDIWIPPRVMKHPSGLRAKDPSDKENPLPGETYEFSPHGIKNTTKS